MAVIEPVVMAVCVWQGARGRRGPGGPTGRDGHRGPAGRDGERGLSGPTGEKGEQGLRGMPGTFPAIGPLPAETPQLSALGRVQQGRRRLMARAAP